MNGNDLFLGLEFLDPKYIELAEFGSFSTEAFYKEEKREARKPRHRIRRVFLLAAVIALLSLLAGCGIAYALKMQDLKITDREGFNPYVSADSPISQWIIATGGQQGTKNYQAARDWYDFEIAYVQAHDWNETFVSPPEYDLYRLYSQEMVDKMDQILKTYDLKPMGAEIQGKTDVGLLHYLGIQDILLPNAPAKATSLSARYYEGGQLSVYSHVKMADLEEHWPQEIYTVCTYSPKDCFDSGVFVLDDTQNWQEWNYTTASGDTFLVLYHPDYFEAYAICDQGDRMLSVYIQTADIYDSFRIGEEHMSQRHVEQLLEVFDFSLEPQPGDPELLNGLPEQYDASQRIQTFDGFTVELKEAVSDGNLAWVTLGITLPEEIAVAYVDPSDGQTFWNLNFHRHQLQCEGAELESLTSFHERDDADGLDNTLEYVFLWTRQEADERMEAGHRWTLTLEKMGQRLSQETLWEKDAVWKFAFTFDVSSDYRKLVFLSEPTEIPAIIGETAEGDEIWGTMTVSNLVLHTHSVYLEMKEKLGYGELSSWQEEEGNYRRPLVVLRDGTAIPFSGFSGRSLDQANTSSTEIMRPASPIPLDQVDHILLVDGTRLFPQRQE